MIIWRKLRSILLNLAILVERLKTWRFENTLELDNRKIIYVGEVDFAENRSAAAVRILNNCKSIALNPDFDVKVVGYSNTASLLCEGFQIFNVKRGRTLISKTFYYLLRSYFFVIL